MDHTPRIHPRTHPPLTRKKERTAPLFRESGKDVRKKKRFKDRLKIAEAQGAWMGKGGVASLGKDRLMEGRERGCGRGGV